MTLLRTVALADLTIDDERSFRHVGIYQELKRAIAPFGLKFNVPASPALGPDATRVLNLAFWQPGQVAEVLPEDRMAADQLAHNAWHLMAQVALGADSGTADGMMLAEAVASAFDVYLVGRLIGHAPDSEFLATQVPAMSEAAEAAGVDEAGFEKLVERMAAEPERCFEELRALLFDTGTALVAATTARDLDALHAASDVLGRAAAAPLGALLHHYELSTWVLHARAYATSLDPCEAVRAMDRELRAAPDAVVWLERHWLDPRRSI
jgi:hypothetical protein